ncbi:hypothetical protein J6590_050455 [Homalodisca vitripennis]|nr:hypothetical protein J6590_050455 [Homalodisca vitripennis]
MSGEDKSSLEKISADVRFPVINWEQRNRCYSDKTNKSCNGRRRVGCSNCSAKFMSATTFSGSGARTPGQLSAEHLRRDESCDGCHWAPIERPDCRFASSFLVSANPLANFVSVSAWRSFSESRILVVHGSRRGLTVRLTVSLEGGLAGAYNHTAIEGLTEQNLMYFGPMSHVLLYLVYIYLSSPGYTDVTAPRRLRPTIKFHQGQNPLSEVVFVHLQCDSQWPHPVTMRHLQIATVPRRTHPPPPNTIANEFGRLFTNRESVVTALRDVRPPTSVGCARPAYSIHSDQWLLQYKEEMFLHPSTKTPRITNHKEEIKRALDYLEMAQR